MVLEAPTSRKYHGWGENGLNALRVVCTWSLTTLDLHSKPTSFTFDLVQGSDPLLIGLDVSEFANTMNFAREPFLEMKRPLDTSLRVFNTYIARKADKHGNRRQHVSIIPEPGICVTSLMSRLEQRTKRAPMVFAKHVHRLTHAVPDEIKSLCHDAGILEPRLAQATDLVDNSCGICAPNGQPLPSRKVSLTHVNEALNQEIQADFTFEYVRKVQRTIFVITDTGTGYTESAIVTSRSIDTIIRYLERLWFTHHGVPVKFSADDECNRRRLRSFLTAQNITYKPKPARRHNKIGIVERKNGLDKNILRKLDREISDADEHTLLSRETFFSNLFSGSKVFSSFQLVRGYSPSIHVIPPPRVIQDFLNNHKAIMATRALQKAIRSRAVNAPQPRF